MHLEDPQFPPLLEGHAVKAPKRPFAEACRLARARKLGAGDVVWSPEARLFAGARCIAGLQLATERREARPDIDREDVEARTAGLATIRWAHPDRYCSLFDADHERAAKREEPLPDESR